MEAYEMTINDQAARESGSKAAAREWTEGKPPPSARLCQVLSRGAPWYALGYVETWRKLKDIPRN